MSLWVNERVVIKHRIGGGVGAARMNAIKTGKTIVTGHTHTLKSEPVEDYNGRRWGVEDGSLADVSCAEGAGPQFAYAEDGPSQARSGFAVLTFLPSGEEISPELVECIKGQAWFRGQKVVSERKRVAA